MLKTKVAERTPIGFWIESPKGAQWTNQGMTRLVGFIIEGAAKGERYIFHVVTTNDIRDEAEGDLATLAATAGVDYVIHSPRDVGVTDESFDALADFANDHVPVEAWISIFPIQLFAARLNAPVAVIFPDAIGLAYHDYADAAWNAEGHAERWRRLVAKNLPLLGNIITFSDHVAREQVVRFFGVDEDRLRIIPHAPPSLDGILPFVKNGKKTPESLFKAATLLRRHAAERGWRYLVDFPFEESSYIAVSTQDRVTKNIRIVADAVAIANAKGGTGIKAFVTAKIDFHARFTPLPGAIEVARSFYDVVSVPDLPRDVHAAFYHCAQLTVHPSVFEGGRGVFPYYESVSVGTPCIMAKGPHVTEFLDDAPEFAPYCFDAYDAVRLAELIERVSVNCDEVTQHQQDTYARLRQRDWAQVADEYAVAALTSKQPASLTSEQPL
ncbi:glycosyl transferase group 1 [Sphingomonas elodea]|uniref:glycosyl transferase group 1 n=1 Tax=Sphingomonas elodea TaxID=179878 RepID=UPI000263100B|nr:glycosyl transferase group 1 [Sphingomonas elodea]